MKQTLSSLVKLALCASVLLVAGCGDGSSSSPVASTAPATATAPVTATTPINPLAIQNIGMKSGAFCAVRGDGAARCWGPGAESWDQSKKAVTGPLKQLLLHGGFPQSSCALNQEGIVFCWNDYGNYESLGRGALQDKGDPKQPVAVLSNVSQLDIGNNTVCALTNDGDLYCWGGDPWYEKLVDRPTKIMGLPKIKQMSVGWAHRCAVGVDSSVWCWGHFKWGSDGTNRSDKEFQSDNPLSVAIPFGGATQVSVGSYFSCAVTAHSASVYCWGRNDAGQIGNNAKGNNTLFPQKVLLEDGEMARQVSVGTDHACAMLTSGAARCWGRKLFGILGNGEGSYGPFEGDEPKPVKVQNSQGEFFGFKGLAAGFQADYNAMCAWGEGNQAWCWGSGYQGRLGDGDSEGGLYVNTPKRVTVIESGWI